MYQGKRLPSKTDQGYCNPTARTQSTIDWFPDDTCATLRLAKIQARMIKTLQKFFIYQSFLKK